MSSKNLVSIKDKLKEKIKSKQAEDSKKKNDPLFDNPMFTEMKNSLSEDEQKKYEKCGKYMYEEMDQITDNGEMKAIVDTVSQIKLMVESGMHPSFLDKEEKEFLKNYLGEKWYETFGYLENDLNRINM
jgi:predicted RNA-binding protein with EMAP domain